MSNGSRTLIVTGLSGAGKSLAIDILEDAGFFCVDNVPAKLVTTFIGLCRSADSEINNLALVTDIRGDGRGDIMKSDFQKALAEFKDHRDGVEILFLEASPESLVSRYQTSRRKHPLADRAGSLRRSIELEKEKLQPLKNAADYLINTTDMSSQELRKQINSILETNDDEKITLTVSSFGYKYGLPMGADFVFDVRFLPNPFYKKELRFLTGNDRAVQDYVMQFPESGKMLDRVIELMTFILPQYQSIGKEHIQVAFGCTGGQHRSVTFANLLEKAFREKGYVTNIDHRDTEKNLNSI